MEEILWQATHTTNYQLNQWAKPDRVMMDDFNADNAKIDAALAARNCRFYTTSYTGDGELTKTWTFPAKPILIVLTCPHPMASCCYKRKRGPRMGPAGRQFGNRLALHGRRKQRHMERGKQF